jgi:hypothetical protein
MAGKTMNECRLYLSVLADWPSILADWPAVLADWPAGETDLQFTLPIGEITGGISENLAYRSAYGYPI